MKILITGGNGFIGGSLARYLAWKNKSLHILSPNRSVLNVANETEVDKYIALHKPDIIIHTANKGGDRTTMGLEDVVHHNLRMFFNIAKHASKVHKIIHLGSGAEYGKHKPIVKAKEEDANKAFPLDDYGFYKSVCSRYIEKTNNMLNLRIFGCYGEREDYRFKFISNTIVKHLLNLPIIINQNVYFDYIYIQDLIRMIEYFIFHDAQYSVYNVTRGEKIDLLSLAHLINEVGHHNSPIQVLCSGFNFEYTSDNQRILKEIGSFEFTSHRDAVQSMMRFFTQRLDTIDCNIIRQDPYLSKCNDIWKNR